MMQTLLPLQKVFNDPKYAWNLLQCEIKLQTSDSITGEDVSQLLQLYMKGVERMNSLLDYRESFFKGKVTSLMSRPNVIKILNKPMSKKKQSPIIQSSPPQKQNTIAQLQLKEKRKQIQMRLAYVAEQHNPDALKKIMAEHNQKQTILSKKIEKIANEHEQRLMKRVRERKLRTMTAKSRSDAFQNIDGNQQDTTGLIDMKAKIQMMENKRDQEQFGTSYLGKKVKIPRRKVKSLSPKRTPLLNLPQESPTKRRVSMDLKQGKQIPSFNLKKQE